MSRKLDDLSDRFRPLAVLFLAKLTEAGIPVLIVDTLRTAAEHKANLKAGTSSAILSKHLDAKARGLAFHGSDAMDVCPFEEFKLHDKDKLQWNTADPVWQRIGEIAEAIRVNGHSLRWGGRWKKPYDPGHVEFQE